MGPSEAEPFWTLFLRSLTGRGLRGVKLVIIDSHEGLKKAARKVLGATWQHCSVHFMRIALANVNVKQRHGRRSHLNCICAGDGGRGAYGMECRRCLRERFPRVSALIEEVIAYTSFHKSHWTQIRSTNPLERLNCEIKRRTNVASIFPNDDAIVRLVGAILREQNDE